MAPVILAAMASYPIIFVAGPWAAGKTRISTKRHKEFGYSYFDLDRHGFDFYNVQPEWDEFCNRLNPVPLVLLLKNRIMAEQRPAAVLSFPQEIEVFSADGSHVGSDQITSYIKQR
jgi:hypothetical protein